MTDDSPNFCNPTTLSPPPGYTHIVATTGGTTVYLSGQLALDASGSLVGKNNLEAQAEQVFRNIEQALIAVGGNLSHVVKLTTFLTDISGLPVFRQVRDRFIAPGPRVPASSLMQVASLANPDFLIEVEAIAWLPPTS